MNNSAGFTLAELVVTIVLVGIIAATAIPTFNNVVVSTQLQINLSNMEIIKNAFVRYYYTTQMNFPTVPENNLLDSEYKDLVLPDGRTPDNLFNGKDGLPYNSNGNPYSYYYESDTSETQFITKKITIKDMDLDSPSYEEFVIGEI
jgi:prepilin-type N-terminal cleavage/methylation domain-containing protein